MKVAIMQPYFMPYIGYFQLINAVDEFIIFDTPQFIRHGWIERNRILKPDGEPLYIKVPLIKHKRETVIKDLRIRNDESWKQKILAQIVPYKKKAPYYNEVVELLNEIFENETDSLAEFNIRSLQKICNYLGISTPIKVWSKMGVSIVEVKEPDEWALNICKAIEASSYINATGGQSFFNAQKYKESNIELGFIESKDIAYKQLDNDFCPWLSIVDVLMFNSKAEVKKMLNDYTLI